MFPSVGTLRQREISISQFASGAHLYLIRMRQVEVGFNS